MSQARGLMALCGGGLRGLGPLGAINYVRRCLVPGLIPPPRHKRYKIDGKRHPHDTCGSYESPMVQTEGGSDVNGFNVNEYECRRPAQGSRRAWFCYRVRVHRRCLDLSRSGHLAAWSFAGGGATRRFHLMAGTVPVVPAAYSLGASLSVFGGCRGTK